jgi:hypothetical protein
MTFNTEALDVRKRRNPPLGFTSDEAKSSQENSANLSAASVLDHNELGNYRQ